MTLGDHTGPAMPRFPVSYWLASSTRPSYPKLEQDMTVDVAVVGAGITGITTACLLAREGKKVALLEAGRLLNGTTGNTTAKITAQVKGKLDWQSKKPQQLAADAGALPGRGHGRAGRRTAQKSARIEGGTYDGGRQNRAQKTENMAHK
jgi:glycine/D-amino acid oxidase-like deaminating enzyme